MNSTLTSPHPDRSIIQEIAMEIGRSAVEHLETMYPAALEAVPRSARVSLRNHIRNQIVATLGASRIYICDGTSSVFCEDKQILGTDEGSL